MVGVPTRTLVAAVGCIALLVLIAYLSIPDSSRPTLGVGLPGAGASAASQTDHFSCSPQQLSREEWTSAGFPHPELVGAVSSFDINAGAITSLTYRFTQNTEVGSIVLADRCASGADVFANAAPTDLVNGDGSTQRCQFSVYRGRQSFECLSMDAGGKHSVEIDFSAGRFAIRVKLSTSSGTAESTLVDLKEITSGLSVVNALARD